MWCKSFFLFTILWELTGGVGPIACEGISLVALTFNIRYGTAKDEGHTWDLRKDSVARVLEEHDPDVVGLQEALDFQLEFLLEKFTDQYTSVGEGREGGLKGEFSAILYRSNRFLLARAGQFWLSETPEEVGSRSWSSLPRIVTWADLLERRSGRRLLVLNTHFSHESEEARQKSASLIREKVRDISRARSPILLMGDFNCRPDSSPHRTLVDGGPEAFSDSQEETQSPSHSTFHGFRGPREGGQPIDWVLFRGGLEPVEYKVLDGLYDSAYPSDHFPVMVRFKW